MNIVNNPNREHWAELVSRPVLDHTALFGQVKAIMDQVEAFGDEALRAYTLQFDQVKLADLAVSREAIEGAETEISPALKAAIDQAYHNIRTFHAAQAEVFEPIETMSGITCWRKSVPIEKVGLYIPGGSAPLFSTILMLGVPAQLAGCGQVLICTPPQADGHIHPAMRYAAKLVGAHHVFKVGGSQAIAALTYGTESIPAVYKIFGPGNQYVTAAKQLATQLGIAIDMPAGPSELMVWADESANPSFVAADLLSQAEHGPDSQVVLVVDKLEVAEAVREALTLQLDRLPRKDIAQQAIDHSRAIVLPVTADRVEFMNHYAPEHLILATDQADWVADQIINAGSVFMGHYTPESLGDYASGTNHTLPTNGYARAYAGVSLDAFVKKITFQHATPQGLQLLGPHVEEMAAAEQLEAHRAAVRIRLTKLANP